jgi:hypothetical protein
MTEQEQHEQRVAYVNARYWQIAHPWFRAAVKFRKHEAGEEGDVNVFASGSYPRSCGWPRGGTTGGCGRSFGPVFARRKAGQRRGSA